MAQEQHQPLTAPYSRRLPVLLVAALAVGCTSPAKREAAILGEAVDRYRRADNARKAEQAETVVAVPCTDAEVCAVKQACLAAISPTVQALTLKDEVAARIADLEAKKLAPDSPEATVLPAKLNDAERLLKEGHEKMAGCEKGLGELRAHHGG